MHEPLHQRSVFGVCIGAVQRRTFDGSSSRATRASGPAGCAPRVPSQCGSHCRAMQWVLQVRLETWGNCALFRLRFVVVSTLRLELRVGVLTSSCALSTV